MKVKAIILFAIVFVIVVFKTLTKQEKFYHPELQVMLTKGESVKGNAQKGMLGSYFEKKVILKVIH